MLWLQTENPSTTGTVKLGGSLTRHVEQDCAISEMSPHLVNIGRMVEVSFSRQSFPLIDISIRTSSAKCELL